MNKTDKADTSCNTILRDGDGNLRNMRSAVTDPRTVAGKDTLIARILFNQTYKPKSGLYIQAAKGLSKLSMIQLGQLLLIINSKA